MENVLPTTTGSYLEIIKRSLRLYRLSFSKIIIPAILLSAVAFIPRFISDFIGQDLFQNVPPFSLYRLWFIPVQITALIFMIAILWHMRCVIKNIHEPLIEDFNIAVKKVIYVFAAALIQGAIIFAFSATIIATQIWLGAIQTPIGTTGSFIPLIIFMIQFFLLMYVSLLFLFFIPLIAIENKGIIAALERSVLLVWNHWLRVFSVQATPWLCYLFLLTTLRFVFKFNIHIYFIEHNVHTLSATIFNAILFALFIPWSAAALLVQLRDLEIRRNLPSAFQ